MLHAILSTVCHCSSVRYEVLPSVFGTLGIFWYAFISYYICFGWRHVYFFLPTLYWYCFSQPDFCADLNSAAVKPFSSPLRLQRYSFSVLCCHFPFSFSGRTVKIICAWGLCPSVSCMAKSAHIPSDIKLSLIYRPTGQSIHLGTSRWGVPRQIRVQACCPWSFLLLQRRSIISLCLTIRSVHLSEA